MADPFDLARFVDAQQSVYDTATSELRAGRKRSHWMWFVFPQLRGLGYSAMAQKYGIASRDEAIAYLEHDVLGPRLRECARLVSAVPGRSMELLMGPVDALKLRSSMTLFASLSTDSGDFVDVLNQCYRGQRDAETIRMLRSP